MEAAKILAVLLLALSVEGSGTSLLDSPDDGYRDRYNKQPNIIYIMADDLGWNDLGFRNPKVKTPNIDALKADGIELTQNYMQPICSPSRASFVTGKYPSNNALQQFVVLVNSQTCLPLEHKLVFEHMKEQGYDTKYLGKWHLGYCNEACLPNNRGIDEFRGVLPGSTNYFNWSNADIMFRNLDGQPSDENIGTHLTIQDGRDARDMIMGHRGSRNPFFMWMTPIAPHEPLEVTSEMFNVHDFLDPSDPDTRQRREYLGLVSALDDLVGQTRDALRDAGLHQNTIIVFSSDNGGANIEQFTGDEASYSNNYPLRNGKYAFTEGGTLVPTLYYDPRLRRCTRGTERDFMMHVTDWLPTFVHLGTPGRKGRDFKIDGIDGVSQLANLGSRYNRRSQRKYNRREEMLVALTNMDILNDDGCSNEDAAYRWRDYKLIYGNQYYLTDPDLIPTEWPKPQESPELPAITGDDCHRMVNGERVVRCLFNVVDDPSERTNLFDVKPELVARLVAKIEQAKRRSVRPAFTSSLGTDTMTAQEYGPYLIPRHDYCEPSIHFPLVAINASCYS